LAGCRGYYETPTHLFLHAGYVPELALAEQPGLALQWRVTDAATAVPHRSGKVAVVGHTPQQSGEVLDLGFLVCIDTNCARGGWLTALEVGTGRVWQADRSGRLRAKVEVTEVTGRGALTRPAAALPAPPFSPRQPAAEVLKASTDPK
jgi:serine/threonine protein phosphatase 1